MSLKNKSNSSSAVPAGQRRAIELQSFGAGDRVFETKAEKPHEREAVAKTVFRLIAGRLSSACNASALKTAISSRLAGFWVQIFRTAVTETFRANGHGIVDFAIYRRRRV